LTVRTEVAVLRLAGTVLRHSRYRGIGTLSKIFNRVFDSNNRVVVKIGESSSINVYLGDYYWSRLIFSDFSYEPDVGLVLSRLLTPDCAFLDCGANIGYWSVIASERISVPRRVVAIEAAAEMFGRLSENRALNGNRFTCVRAAVADSSGQTLEFAVPKAHASASLKMHRDAPAGARIERVETVALDDIFRDHLEDFPGPKIIKLDVEGAEIAALEGARRLLAGREIAVIYEDHGHDPGCAVTEYLLDHIGFRAFFLDSGKIQPINTKNDLVKLKVDSMRGYNLIACPAGSEFFEKLRR
jgi:FkbM family methyltransferase